MASPARRDPARVRSRCPTVPEWPGASAHIAPKVSVSGLATVQRSIDLGGRSFAIRSLSPQQQFADPHGRAVALGIAASDWALFGQIWPADRLLAQAMSRYPVAGKRILHLGCGLGLASLVLQARGADVTASDHHPLARALLDHNASRNGLTTIPFHDLSWSVAAPDLGRFDLIVGGDLLHQRDHPEQLAALMDRHAGACCAVVLTDPGASAGATFTRALALQGYTAGELRSPMDAKDPPPYRGRLLHYTRGATAASTPDAAPAAGPAEPTTSKRRRRA